MWKAYDELAWTEAWLEDPQGVEEEVATYHRLMEEHARRPIREVLHLGCGAGAHDRALKRHFSLTGVDLNNAMLRLARRANPEVEYHQGDMRSVRLGRRFDAVVIPDSIDYMATARHHLRPGGALLVVPSPGSCSTTTTSPTWASATVFTLPFWRTTTCCPPVTSSTRP